MFWFVKVHRNVGNITFKVDSLSEIKEYFKSFLMILSLLYCILLITLLYGKISIAENYALFGVYPTSLNFNGLKKGILCKSVSVLHCIFVMYCSSVLHCLTALHSAVQMYCTFYLYCNVHLHCIVYLHSTVFVYCPVYLY